MPTRSASPASSAPRTPDGPTGWNSQAGLPAGIASWARRLDYPVARQMALTRWPATGKRKPAPAAARGYGRGGGQVMSRPGRAGLDAAGACHVVGGGLAGGRGRDAGPLEVRDVDGSG